MGKLIVQILLFLLPWTLRRVLMVRLFGFSLAKDSFIGYSLIKARYVELGSGAKIGHLNLIGSLNRLVLGRFAIIGNMNIFSGGLNVGDSFLDNINRDPSFVIGDFSAVTHQHLFDCTDLISIGKYVTFAGFRSQVLTHGINFYQSRQEASPVNVGDYCLIGSGSILLKGCTLGSCVVVGAGAVVPTGIYESYKVYAGSPAIEKKSIELDAKYFKRKSGVVN